MNKGMNMLCNGFNNFVTCLVNRTADSLGVSLSNELIDKLIREATEIMVMDWCEDFDYGRDAEWEDLMDEVEAGSTYGEDLVQAIEDQMDFMGTLGVCTLYKVQAA